MTVSVGQFQMKKGSCPRSQCCGAANCNSSMEYNVPESGFKNTESKVTEGKETVALATEAWINACDALASYIAAPPEFKPLPVENLLSSFSAVSDSIFAMLANPTKAFETSVEVGEDWAQLWSSLLSAEPLIEPERGDRRFGDEDWKNNPYYSALKQSYLLMARHLRMLVKDNAVDDPAKSALAMVLVDQFLNATAPTNFALTNPQVVRATIETAGANLVNGFANMIADMQEGKGLVRRRAPDAFRVGDNLAATPGGVIYQNDLFQLIQYTPTTDKVRKRPLLYVPPLVNKFYMIDLQPKSSLIRWLVEQGETVFVISWVDPDETHRDNGIDEYVGTGILEAMDVVTRVTGEDTIDLFGFCMGGTLIAIAQAVLAARGEHQRIGSATLIGSLIDFHDLKEWAAFVTEAHTDVLDAELDKLGYIDKADLQRLFSLMRSNDLIWSAYVNHYLLGKDAPPSDLLYWFEDGSNIPRAFLSTYNRSLLLNNHLRVPGEVTVLGEKLDLSKCLSPILFVALKDDHVSAWTAVYDGLQYFGGPATFVLGGSGHNAGVINPPAAGKHGYWLNDDLVGDPEAWFAGATKQEGSWWPYWMSWLQEQQGDDLVDARPVGCGVLPQLEAAPGSFVTKLAG